MPLEPVYGIELDISWDYIVPPEPFPGVKAWLQLLEGPAGGNPVYLFEGTKENLGKFLRERYCSGFNGDTAEFYLARAKVLSA